MGLLRRAILTAGAEVAWRWPGRARRMLGRFSLAERGSMVDMLAAAESTERADLRRKYYLHALDEWRHAGIFADRLRALGGGSRAEAVIHDAGLLVEHGVVGGRTLFERLGELEFLAFVYVAERDAVEQFDVYVDRRLPDEGTLAALKDILKDEAFHVSYSRQECERFRKAGRGAEVDRALFRVRTRRLWEGWLRFSRDLGDLVTTGWLTVLYFLVVSPFRLLARHADGGWAPPPPPVPAAAEG